MERLDTMNRIKSLINKAIKEENHTYIDEAFNIAWYYNIGVDSQYEIFMAEDESIIMVEDDVYVLPEM